MHENQYSYHCTSERSNKNKEATMFFSVVKIATPFFPEVFFLFKRG
jgi:hypothetical protein